MFYDLKHLTLSGAAVAVTVLAAGSASALTFGSIPGAGVVNDGLEVVYGPAVTEVSGYYGATLALLGASSDVKVEFLGSEASRTNEFHFEGSTLFTSTGVAGSFDTSANGMTTVAGVSVGVLDFLFDHSRDVPPPVTPDQVVNGANPDGAALGSPANFFVTFNPTVDGIATSGQVVDIWFDDGGAGPDDNHDDMVIRLSVTSGSISIVPVPASVPLLLTALGGLGFMARRKRKST